MTDLSALEGVQPHAQRHEGGGAADGDERVLDLWMMGAMDEHGLCFGPLHQSINVCKAIHTHLLGLLPQPAPERLRHAE